MILAANFAANNLWWPGLGLVIVGAIYAAAEGALTRRRNQRAAGRRT